MAPLIIQNPLWKQSNNLLYLVRRFQNFSNFNFYVLCIFGTSRWACKLLKRDGTLNDSPAPKRRKPTDYSLRRSRVSQVPCECQVSPVPCEVVEGLKNFRGSCPTINAKVLVAAVNSHCVPVVGVTTLLDHNEFFANMWLPNCPVFMIAMKSSFNNQRIEDVVRSKCGVRVSLVLGPRLDYTGDEAEF